MARVAVGRDAGFAGFLWAMRCTFHHKHFAQAVVSQFGDEFRESICYACHHQSIDQHRGLDEIVYVLSFLEYLRLLR